MSIVNNEEGFTELLKLNLREELLLRGNPVVGIDVDDTALAEGQVFKYDATLDALVYAGATVDPDTGIWTFDRSIEIPSGSLQISETINISEAGDVILYNDEVVPDVHALPSYVFEAEGGNRNFVKEPFSQETVVVQPVFDTVLTTNPFVITFPAQRDTYTIQSVLKANGPMTNFRGTIKDVASGKVLKYIPSKADVEAGTGTDIIAGDVIVNYFSDDPDSQNVTNLGFGNSIGFPFLSFVSQRFVDTEIPYIRDLTVVDDNYSRYNSSYTSTSATTGGFVVNYQGTATSDTATDGQFNAGVAATSNPTLITDGSGTFAQSDIIQISGSRANDGYYEVEDHTGTTLTIRGVGTVATVEDFSKTDFETTEDDATITKVNVSIIRAGADGFWEEGAGSSTPITYTDIGAGQETIYSGDGFITEYRKVYGNNTNSRLEMAMFDSDISTFNNAAFMNMQDTSNDVGFIQGDGAGNITGTSSIQFDASDMQVVDSINTTGLKYQNDYASNFVDRSLVDKGYSDANVTGRTVTGSPGTNSILVYDGVNLSWDDVPAAGNDTDVQFNNSGILGADDNFKWNGTKLAISAGGSNTRGIQLSSDANTERLNIDVAADTFGGIEIKNSNTGPSAQTSLLLRTDNSTTRLGQNGTFGWQIAARGPNFTVANQPEDLIIEYRDDTTWRGALFIEHDTANVCIGDGSVDPATKLHVTGVITGDGANLTGTAETLNLNQLNSTQEGSVGADADMIFNTTLGRFRIYQQSSWHSLLTPSQSADTLTFTAGGLGTSDTARYMWPGGGYTTAPTRETKIRIPRSGNLKNLYVHVNEVASGSEAITYTVAVNGTPQLITATVNANVEDGDDVSNEVLVSAGAEISIIVTKGAIAESPQDITCTIGFEGI
jgi:hypothetical protein